MLLELEDESFSGVFLQYCLYVTYCYSTYPLFVLCSYSAEY